MSRKLRDIIANPDLDIFSSPILQTSIVGELLLDVFPITPVLPSQPIQFDVPATFLQMTDPNFIINVAVKITNTDGSNLVNDAEVACTNLLLHSMFRDVILKVNDTVVSQGTGCYPYKAYIETNYTFSSQAKQSAIGLPQMYIQETGGSFNSIDGT